VENTDKLIKATLQGNISAVKTLVWNELLSESAFRAALWWACRKGKLDIVDFLISYTKKRNKDDPYKYDLEFNIAFYQAQLENQQEVLGFLIENIPSNKLKIGSNNVKNK